MRRFFKLFSWFIIVLLVYPSVGRAEIIDLPSVTVLADPSLSKPMAQVAQNYSRTNQVTVLTIFSPVRDQAERIDEGEAADIVITPLADWLQELKLKGLIDISTQSAIASNKLAVIAPIGKDAPKLPLTSKEALRLYFTEPSTTPLLAVADPDIRSEGEFTRKLLAKQDVHRETQDFTMSVPAKLLAQMQGPDVDPAHAQSKAPVPHTNWLTVQSLDPLIGLVTNRQALGIVYYSDAVARRDVRILDTVPVSLSGPIIYQTAVIASDNMASARKFLEYLKSPEVAEILKHHGFEK